MDNMASAKSLSTTPFSINDILTRNNTSIFRRIAGDSSSPPHPQTHSMDGDFRGSLHRRGFHQYRQSDSPIPDNVSSDTEDTSAKPYERQSPVFYYHNNNNNNESTASHYGPHAAISAKAGDGLRPRSLECYLATGENVRSQRNRRKSDDYFMSAETALDMRRRCASNDSGEWFWRVIFVWPLANGHVFHFISEKNIYLGETEWYEMTLTIHTLFRLRLTSALRNAHRIRRWSHFGHS